MDAEDETRESLTLRLSASSDKYRADDARWTEQFGRLVHDLRIEVGNIQIVSEPTPGSKGAAEAVILALGSAGAFTTALEVFKAWLARERTRSLSVTVDDRGVSRTFTVSGSELDRDSFQGLAEVAIRRGFRVR